MNTKICIVCDKDFIKPENCGLPEWKNKRKFCSKTCSDRYKVGKPTWNKGIKTGIVPKTAFKKGEFKHPETAFKKGQIPWNKGKTRRTQKNCLYCFKKFSVVLSREKAQFCSYECKGKYQTRNNPWKECTACKTKFQKHRPDSAKSWKSRKYCSQKCQWINAGRKIGKDNYRWRGGISPLSVQIRGLKECRQWVRDIFRRDDWTCQLCKARSGNGKKVVLNADHYPKAFSIILKENSIDTVQKALFCKELWDIDNGRTLCENCHKIETAKLKKTL